jgi:hypothetical protein
MYLTNDQWRDITLVISSYRADLASEFGEDCHEVQFIEGLINEILEQQGPEIEFELDGEI